MLAHLRQPGASLSIIPEGIAGIFLASDQTTERIFLSRRKGFVKLAIQGGAGARLIESAVHAHMLHSAWLFFFTP
jgi:hypothetical protein